MICDICVLYFCYEGTTRIDIFAVTIDLEHVPNKVVVITSYYSDLCTEGEDYTRVSDNLLMESGFAAGACTPLIVSVLKDGVLETDETFHLLTDASGPAMPSSNNGGITRITIVDDDSTCEYQPHDCVASYNIKCKQLAKICCALSLEKTILKRTCSVYPGQQELDAIRSTSDNCTKSFASAAQIGGGVVGGLIAGVLLTLILAVIILLIIGWRWFVYWFGCCLLAVCLFISLCLFGCWP